MESVEIMLICGFMSILFNIVLKLYNVVSNKGICFIGMLFNIVLKPA